jgi:DNA-binding response OmpR family regulator
MTSRIVVADDDPDIRRLIVFTLRRRGYEVHEAGAGDAALELVRKELPDLVVLDVMMPGLTGIEVAQMLKANADTASIPIIILSAKGQAAEVNAGIDAGAHAYMVKPFTPQDLAAKIRELLGAKESAEENRP